MGDMKPTSCSGDPGTSVGGSRGYDHVGLHRGVAVVPQAPTHEGLAKSAPGGRQRQVRVHFSVEEACRIQVAKATVLGTKEKPWTDGLLPGTCLPQLPVLPTPRAHGALEGENQPPCDQHRGKLAKASPVKGAGRGPRSSAEQQQRDEERASKSKGVGTQRSAEPQRWTTRKSWEP